ncbi:MULTISPECIES: flagellar filament capping protein FliD [unclassified Candidatus Frackibacter]|uniref:flagellar filament capping protein FliD n=1 Tax=unclassified Candidatus Frackibacter TaxID=2648818 RepID=UPI0007962D2E|nr:MULTISPECIES: flagellar filament capping protein FliD [unclassified Candidatus Frackibacter]KXS41259.1 MAG: flagellar hook-associated protein 2 [Candidatus Frackibacter sp. T328-2]SDC72639.1 flagellar hook-associated protein 2 [Candidatus Frackibacter sp. WG11]SEM86898.1 flagellar hook-associated protein 2 [Candidatus Frackibacter sp. WG12]SFL95948.1 flagellar hook-associated protein 2 [Candidatus Frackibacter sp. WG13]
MADLSMDGLATGMATGNIINQILNAEYGTKLQNLSREKSNLKTEKDAWRDVNSRISNLENKMADLRLSSTFDSNKTTSSSKDVADATATTAADASSYTLDISQLAKKHRVASAQQVDSTSDLGLNGGNSGSFTIELDGISKSFNVSIDGPESLNDVRDAINNASGNDDGNGNKLVESSVVDNTLIIEGVNTGTNNMLSFQDPDNILDNDGTNDLGFDLDINGNVNTASELQAAQDAQFSVNGLAVTRSSNQGLDDVVNEVTFNLKTTGATTIEVSKDIDKATSAIQEFVDQYNSVQSFIGKKLDYNQETGEAGALQGSGTLMRLQSKLRQMITNSVDNNSDYDQLAMVGIEINRDGTMEFDSNKFKESIADKPNEVKKLFNADTDEGDSFNGIATKVDGYLDLLVQSNTGVIPEKVDSYEIMVENVDEQIDSVNDNLEQERERLQSEFTAMETAISKMNSQMSWMQSQLASLGGSASSISSML